jgi:hypothetical protein
MANSFQSYALALLTYVRSQEDVNDNPPLGIAIRRDATDISFIFIAELAKCEIPAVKYLGNALSTLRDTFHAKILYANQHTEQQWSLRQSGWLGNGGAGTNTTNRWNHEASYRPCKFLLDLPRYRM